MKKNQNAPARHSFDLALSACVLVANAAALFYAREQSPPGLNNDVAEEALRGVLLVDARRLEIMTFSIGNSAETLYL